jgi:hypothetical protein
VEIRGGVKGGGGEKIAKSTSGVGKIAKSLFTEPVLSGIIN